MIANSVKIFIVNCPLSIVHCPLSIPIHHNSAQPRQAYDSFAAGGSESYGFQDFGWVTGDLEGVGVGGQEAFGHGVGVWGGGVCAEGDWYS